MDETIDINQYEQMKANDSQNSEQQNPNNTISNSGNSRPFNSDITTSNNNSSSPLLSLPTSQGLITKNQPDPTHIINLQKCLRSESQRLNCPYCQNYITTEVNTKQNIGNILCCIFTLYVPWCLFKCCQRKDFNCLDAKHKCPSCESTLASYKAC
jgi:hypothetical protein